MTAQRGRGCSEGCPGGTVLGENVRKLECGNVGRGNTHLCITLKFLHSSLLYGSSCHSSVALPSIFILPITLPHPVPFTLSLLKYLSHFPSVVRPRSLVYT